MALVTAGIRRFAPRSRATAPILSIVGALAACTYVGLVNPAESSVAWPCPFKVVTGGLDCPGCGGTRAAHQLLHGDLGSALGYNALFVLSLPFVLYAWAAWALPALTGRQLPAVRLPPKTAYAVLGVVVGWWVVRNVPVDPLTGLHSDR